MLGFPNFRAFELHCLLTAATLLLLSCESSPVPISTLPLQTSHWDEGREKILNPENGLAELFQLNSSSASIVELRFNLTNNELESIYMPDGFIRSWDLKTQKSTKEIKVDPARFDNVTFDFTGQFVALFSSGDSEDMNSTKPVKAIYTVWNVNNENVIVSSPKSNYSIPSMAITSDGKWCVSITEWDIPALKGYNDLTLDDLTNKEVIEVGVNLARKKGEDNFQRVAFDSINDLIAVADDIGNIKIFQFRPPKDIVLNSVPIATIKWPSHTSAPPIALSFDPSRHWLSLIAGNNLYVWDIHAFGHPLLFSMPLSAFPLKSARLAFHPTKPFLAIGSEGGWVIVDISKKNKIAEGNIGDSTKGVAFDFSGSIFAWSGSNGIIHIMGNK